MLTTTESRVLTYYSISDDIDGYQTVFEHTLSKLDFSIGAGIYMLPSNLMLNIEKPVTCNNKF